MIFEPFVSYLATSLKATLLAEHVLQPIANKFAGIRYRYRSRGLSHMEVDDFFQQAADLHAAKALYIRQTLHF